MIPRRREILGFPGEPGSWQCCVPNEWSFCGWFVSSSHTHADHREGVWFGSNGQPPEVPVPHIVFAPCDAAAQKNLDPHEASSGTKLSCCMAEPGFEPEILDWGRGGYQTQPC